MEEARGFLLQDSCPVPHSWVLGLSDLVLDRWNFVLKQWCPGAGPCLSLHSPVAACCLAQFVFVSIVCVTAGTASSPLPFCSSLDCGLQDGVGRTALPLQPDRRDGLMGLRSPAWGWPGPRCPLLP